MIVYYRRKTKRTHRKVEGVLRRSSFGPRHVASGLYELEYPDGENIHSFHIQNLQAKRRDRPNAAIHPS